MNIVYVGPFDTNGVYKGGIAVVVQEMMNLYKEKYKGDTKLIPFNCCRIKRRHDTQGKINFQNIKNSFEIAKNLVKTIKANNAKCVYYNSSTGYPLLKDLFILWYAKKIARIKVIVHIHFAEYKKILVSNRLAKSIMITLLKKMDGVVFLSKETQMEFVKNGLNKEKTTTIYNFHSYNVDEEVIQKKALEYKNDNELNLIFLGSISKRKGILDLLNALKKIKTKYVLHICGIVTDKTIENEYLDIIRDINNGQIIEHGYVSGRDKEELLSKADILILPSYSEGFPLVLLEAAAYGCAIISTKVGAITEVFSDKNGQIINAGDVNALADAISSLSQNNLSDYFISNYKLSKNYSLEVFMEKTISFIERVINQNEK